MATKNKDLQHYFDQVKLGFEQILRAKKLTPVHVVLLVSLCTVFFFIGIVLSGVINGSPAKQNVLPKRLAAPKKVITGSMWMEPNSIQVEQNESFDITVFADAKNNVINGVDVVLAYDEEFFEVEEISDTAPDLIYPRKKAESGKILITAVKTQADDKAFSEFAVAAIKLKAKQKGTSALLLKLDGTKASTIIKAGTSENILNNVQNKVIVGVL